MQDRLKFRVFGNENATFLKGMYKVNSFEIHDNGETANIYFDDGRFDGCVWLCNVDIMQCTGLKDSTGKLIYEGDLVKDCYNRIYQVKYSKRFCSYLLYPIDDEFNPMAFYPDVELLIIGNIYENSDLLENEVQDARK